MGCHEFWSKLTDKGYPTDEEIRNSGERIPEWDKVPQTTVWERWAYYFYYNGNNGINNYAYVPNMVQYLTSQNGWDPTRGPAGVIRCDADSPCDTRLGGSVISVESIMLVVGGLNAFIQAILLTTIGSLADYGNNGSHMLLIITLISCAAQIVFLVFDEESSSYWGVPLAVGLVFQVSYGASLVFYWAIFPQLAINEPKVRAAKREKVDPEEYMVIESIARNHISAVSTAWSNIGFLVISVLNIGVGQAMASRYNTPVNQLPKYTNSIFSAMCGGYWLLCAIPWFVLQKNRPGPPLPPNTNYWTLGWRKVGRALREYHRLPQTFLFFVGYFFLMDAVSSHNQVTQVLTYSMTDYNGLVQTYMNLVNSACSIIGCLLFLYLQKRFQLATKTMLLISTGFTLAIPLWGCFGLGTDMIGYHHVVELWIYNAWFGIFTAPFYAYSQTLMSELIPMGCENMFFALFGITSKVAQFFGPAVVGGITQGTRDARTGFIYCTLCQFLALVIISFVNMEKAEIRLRVYEEQERRKSETVQDLLDHMHSPLPPPPPSPPLNATPDIDSSIYTTPYHPAPLYEKDHDYQHHRHHEPETDRYGF